MKVIQRIKKDKRVASISDERSAGDGFWVELKPGYIDGVLGTSAIHEETPEECLACLSFVEKDAHV